MLDWGASLRGRVAEQDREPRPSRQSKYLDSQIFR